MCRRDAVAAGTAGASAGDGHLCHAALEPAAHRRLLTHHQLLHRVPAQAAGHVSGPPRERREADALNTFDRLFWMSEVFGMKLKRLGILKNINIFMADEK